VVLTFALLARLPPSRFPAPAEVTGTFDLHGKWTWSGLRFCTLRREASGSIYTLRTFADKAAFDDDKRPQSERAVVGFSTDVQNRKGMRQHRFDVLLGTGHNLKLSAAEPEMKAEWLRFLPPAAPGAQAAQDEADDDAEGDGSAALDERHRAIVEQLGHDKFEQYKQAHADSDTDGDGKLNMDELAAAVAILGFDVTSDRLEALVRKDDEDGDGAVGI
jgi:hypothetical protein